MPKTLELSQTASTSPEVVLHELGGGLAVSLATVQNELARYPNDLGAFLLDEVEVTIPARLRVDELGQMRVQIVEEAPEKPEGGQIVLRIKPVVGATQPVPQGADQPLSALGDVLSAEAIQRLEALRVFSVEDFLRITRDVAGQRAVESLLPEVRVHAAIDRATLFTLPDISPRLASTLIQMGIYSPSELAKRDSQTLADEINKRLEGKLEKSLAPDDVSKFQGNILRLMQIRLPVERLNLT